MTKDAVVLRQLPGGMAEVAVSRASACGGNCSSCGGCKLQNELKICVENPIGAKPGQKVVLETASGKIFAAIFLVYLLPLITMVLGYSLAALLGRGEGLCIASGFAGLALGILLMVWIHRNRKDKKQFHYCITQLL